MVLSESNAAALVLEQVSQLQTKLGEFASDQTEQHKILEDLDKELEETLNVMVSSFLKLKPQTISASIN